MGLKATKVQLEQPALLECPVMESLVPMVRKESEEPLVPLEPPVLRVSKVPLVTQVPLAPLALLAQLDLRALVVSLVRPALWVLRETLVPQALRVLRDTREIRELRDLRASRDTPAQLEPLGLREPQVLKEIRDIREPLESLEPQVFQDLLAPKDTQDVLVSPVLLVMMELQVREDLPGHRDLPELLV